MALACCQPGLAATTPVVGSGGELLQSHTEFLTPGDAGSMPWILGEWNQRLLFLASTNGDFNDQHLWTVGSDGVQPVAIAPGSMIPHSRPSRPIRFQDKLYFNIGTTLSNTRVWQFDGTVAGPATAIASLYRDAIIFRDELYLEYLGIRKFDGTTTSDIAVPEELTNIDFLYADDSRLLLQARHADYGSELWQYDGQQFELALDLVPGSESGFPLDFVSWNDELYFVGNAGESVALWRLEGSSAVQISPAGVGASKPVVFNGKLHFVGREDNLAALYQYDGNSVEPVWIPSTDQHSFISNLFVDGDLLYSLTNDRVLGEEVWVWDGTTGRRVADLDPGESGIMGGDPFDIGFTRAGNSIYFLPNTLPGGNELWSLTPVPEPHAAALMLAGLAGLGIFRWRSAFAAL